MVQTYETCLVVSSDPLDDKMVKETFTWTRKRGSNVLHVPNIQP